MQQLTPFRRQVGGITGIRSSITVDPDLWTKFYVETEDMDVRKQLISTLKETKLTAIAWAFLYEVFVNWQNTFGKEVFGVLATGGPEGLHHEEINSITAPYAEKITYHIKKIDKKLRRK